MAKNQPAKPAEKPKAPLLQGPTIIGMSLMNGDTICEETVDIQWEKEPDEVATLFLTSSSMHTAINPPSFNLPAGADSGVSTFQISHACDVNENDVMLDATLVQGTAAATDSRTVTVSCPPCNSWQGNMMANARSKSVVGLAPFTEMPIRLTRGKNRILFGRYDPNTTTVSVVVHWVDADGQPQVRDPVFAVRVGQTKRWKVTLPRDYWRQGVKRVLVQLVYDNGGTEISRTFPAVILVAD